VGASSALSAVEFSQKISCGSVDKGDNSGKTVECCGEGDGSCQSTVNIWYVCYLFILCLVVVMVFEHDIFKSTNGTVILHKKPFIYNSKL
jgi:hypothetical protein